MNEEARPAAGEMSLVGFPPAIQLFQFCMLMWATEFNAKAAGLQHGIDAQTVNAMNALLTAYAALEALVLETAFVSHPSVYADSRFRKAGILTQYADYLRADGREGEAMPLVVSEVSAHRVALTHSEPDNQRTFQVSSVISATDAARFAVGVRAVAEWLWRGTRPGAVAAAFDSPNVFFRDGAS
jgi:hypothetical protein